MVGWLFVWVRLVDCLVSYLIGLVYLFDDAVALGGFGSITGSLIAGIIIGIVESVGGLSIDPSFEIAGIFIGQPQLYASLVCLIAFILLYLFVTKTETGTALQATAQDRQAAEILGIPSNKMFALGWAIGLSLIFGLMEIVNFAHGERGIGVG